MPIKQEVVEQLNGHWQIGLFEAPIKAPLSWCYGCLCPCCMTCQQRQEILDVIGEPYVCCGGLFPCGPLGQPQDKNCIFLETCCCPGCALAGNRFLIQTRFNRENTCCDDCLLWSVCLAQTAICILQMVGVDVPDEIENLVDCADMAVDGCMLAQQKVELDFVKSTGYAGPHPGVMGAMSPFQQQIMAQAKPPPQYAMGGAAVIGAAVGGAAGAAAMTSAAGKPQMQSMAPPGGQAYGPGFMATLAPNGRPWGEYCNMAPPFVDGQGFISGPWGECLAWSKVFEIQNPGWDQRPEYRNDGPTGQVMNAMVNACPGNSRQQVQQAAEHMESVCEQCCRSGQPLPVINQRA